MAALFVISYWLGGHEAIDQEERSCARTMNRLLADAHVNQ